MAKKIKRKEVAAVSYDIADYENENNIQTVGIGDTCEDYLKLFGANKNLYRVIPSMSDGLKPVERRFLYSTWLYTKGDPNKLRKMVILAANAVAFHPHGDKSIADVAGSMAQPWNNNACYIFGGGNFGSIRGDAVGAVRYIEGKLSKFTHKCFFEDFKYANVDMKMTYQGDAMEPEFLPAKYPVILFNPHISSIGYAFSSNIPPFNIEEVLKATIKLIKEPNSKVFLVPDSPTGCNVVDIGTFKDINETGTGKFMLEATYEIDHNNNDITITSLPLQVSSSMVIERVLKLMTEHKIEGIRDIFDNTYKDVVSLTIDLKSDVDPEKFIKKLFKKNVGLRMTYPVVIKVIEDYVDYDYGVRDLLIAWIEQRREIIRSMYNTELVKLSEDNHMNDIMIFVTNTSNASRTVEIVTKSDTIKDASKKLMSEYNITSLQASTIANMRVSQLTRSMHESYVALKDKYMKRISELEIFLDSDDKVDENMIKEQEEGIKLFGGPRKSKIIKIDNETNVPDTMHIIGISKDGFVKKLNCDDFVSLGSVGKIPKQPIIVLKISNRSSILLFDSDGKVTRISVSTIPDCDVNDNGISLIKYFKTTGDVIGVIEDKTLPLDTDFITITKKGYGKKTVWEEFEKIRDVKAAITLDKEDKLVAILPASTTTVKDIIIYTNQGNGVRLNIKTMKTFKRAAKGSRQLTLRDDEEVVGLDKIEPMNKYLVYITSMGKMKLTETKNLPEMNRNEDTVSLINLDNNETLVGIKSVSLKDTIIVYRKNGDPVEVLVSSLNVTTRMAKADKVVKTPKGDTVISFSIK